MRWKDYEVWVTRRQTQVIHVCARTKFEAQEAADEYFIKGKPTAETLLWKHPREVFEILQWDFDDYWESSEAEVDVCVGRYL